MLENITRYFKRLNITYQVEELQPDDLPPHNTNEAATNAVMLHATLLKAENEHIMAIFSEDDMCNLELISKHLNKKISAACEDFQQTFLNTKGLMCLLAIPQLSEATVLVDKNLLLAQKFYMYSGTKNHYIILDQEQFDKLTKDTLRISFAIPILQIKQDMERQENDKESPLYDAIRKYTSLSIQKNLTDTLAIPPLSTTVRQIIALSADPNSSADELIAIVKFEPALAAQVVGWAASPYFSAPGTVNSIKDAIVRVLGYDLVMNLAMGLAMGKVLDVPKEYQGGITEFWRQSLYCALVMDKLNKLLPKTQRGNPGLTYLSGLLNNFGYLVIAHVFPDHFTKLSNYLKANKHISHIYVEHYLLGICREQISSQLLQAWNLPEEVITILRHQSDETYTEQYHCSANLCLLSKSLLAANNIGENSHQLVNKSQLYQQLGLTITEVDTVLEDIFASSDQIDAMTKLFPS